MKIKTKKQAARRLRKKDPILNQMKSEWKKGKDGLFAIMWAEA